MEVAFKESMEGVERLEIVKEKSSLPLLFPSDKVLATWMKQQHFFLESIGAIIKVSGLSREKQTYFF